MNRALVISGLVLAVVAGAALASSIFVVSNTQEAIVLRLGKPIAVINRPGAQEAGLKTKAPFIDRVVLYDRRSQGLDIGEQTVIGVDKNRLVVEASLRYRIDDPLAYYRAVGDTASKGRVRLADLAQAALGQVLGEVKAGEIVSGPRAPLTSKALEIATAQTKAAAMGVSLSEIRIERVDVPDAERAAIFTRMHSGADVEAAQIKAGGDEQRREIQAAADRDAAAARAEGLKQAQIVRGQGDAKAAAILAASYSRDPAFAAFYRSMQGYETMLGQGDTTLVLSPDSPLFKYLNAPGQ